MQVPMNKSAKILLATALLLVALAAVILYFSSTVFLQLFIAFALAYVLNPFVVFLKRKGAGRIPGILTLFTAALVICACIALLIGGQMFGIMGMLLAVPAIAVLQVFLRSLAAWRRESDFYRGA